MPICKGDPTVRFTAEPDLSGEAKLEIRRVLGKLVLTIGDFEHTLSPEQEDRFWEDVHLVWQDDRRIK